MRRAQAVSQSVSPSVFKIDDELEHQLRVACLKSMLSRYRQMRGRV